MEKLNKTQEKILDMMTENGRLTKKQVLSKPRAWVEGNRPNEPLFYKNMFTFLSENLEFDKKLDKKYEVFTKASKNSYSLEDMEEFAKKIDDHAECRYTYNFTRLFNGDFDYCVTTNGDYKDGDMIILRTHNGVDARQGMSTPFAFKVPDGYSEFINNMRKLTVACNDIVAESDDGEGDVWEDWSDAGPDDLDINNVIHYDDDFSGFLCKGGEEPEIYY